MGCNCNCNGVTIPVGPKGVGVDGTNGKTVLNGIIDPVSGLGAIGDFYINTVSNQIFGPKTSGGWGSGVSIVGPTGPAGPTESIENFSLSAVPAPASVAITVDYTKFVNNGDGFEITMHCLSNLSTDQFFIYDSTESDYFLNGITSGENDAPFSLKIYCYRSGADMKGWYEKIVAGTTTVMVVATFNQLAVDFAVVHNMLISSTDLTGNGVVNRVVTKRVLTV